PIGVNLFWNTPTTSYPQLPPPYPGGYTVDGVSNPFPPFAATEGHVFVFDPLGVAEAALSLPNTPPVFNGPATVPQYPNSLASWTYIQTFPYQQTYNPGA